MQPQLFEHYPDLKLDTPHLSFAEQPTPIELVRNHSGYGSQSFTGQLYIKRDDLTHPEYGGNKVRKLEFIIAEALQQNKTEIVTFGAIGTNHGVATALFCKKHGLKCTIILFDQPVTKTVQANLKAMANLGANLIYKKTIFSAAVYFYWKQLTAHRNQYFLFAGGSNVAGCLGFVNAAFELKQQINQHQAVTPDFIYCPIGSSATIAGLTLGCALAGINTKVIGVRVAPSHVGLIPACTQETINKLMYQTYRYIQTRSSSELPNTLPPILMENDFYGDGYGVATNAASAATQKFCEYGISLDATYTAKTAAALLSHMNKEPNKHFLYWHTFNSASMENILCLETPNTLSAPLQNALNTALDYL